MPSLGPRATATQSMPSARGRYLRREATHLASARPSWRSRLKLSPLHAVEAGETAGPPDTIYLYKSMAGKDAPIKGSRGPPSTIYLSQSMAGTNTRGVASNRQTPSTFPNRWPARTPGEWQATARHHLPFPIDGRHEHPGSGKQPPDTIYLSQSMAGTDAAREPSL